ncbi:MAG: hypothetical protein ACE5R4_12685 [Armatimonadota bacterium]
MMPKPATTPISHLLPLLLVLTAGQTIQAEPQDLDTRLMLSTVLLSSPDSTGTAFVLARPSPGKPGNTQLLLITAEHVMRGVKGDETTIIFHKLAADGGYTKLPLKLRIRQAGKALWTKHPTADIAAMVISPPPDAVQPHIPVDLLASEDDFARSHIRPGDTVRLVGFPHPIQFQAGPAGFGVVRTGCIASYPLPASGRVGTFLVDMNTMEGDSGGPVYLRERSRHAAGNTKPLQLILGLMVGQQFFDEEFELPYESGKRRHRMGLGIVAPAPAIRETIDLIGR